jgi:hypothetical protein
MLAFFGYLLPLYGFPLTFALAGLVALLGALATRKGFSYPIPKVPVSDVEKQKPLKD